jgi:tetratricopeptide (TPR) repeat protein
MVAIAIVFLTLVTFGIGSSARPTVSGWLRTASVQYRTEMWGDAWRQFRTRPVLGRGPESYYGNYARFRSAKDARSQGLTIPEAPHDIYLARAVSTGIVGLLTYVFLIGAAGLIVAKRAPRLTRSRRLLVATFGAGLVGYLVQGLFSIDVPPLAFTGWVILAAVAVLADSPAAGAHDSVDAVESVSQPNDFHLGMQKRASVSESLLRRSRRALTPAAFAVVAAFLIVTGLAPYRADHVAWVAERSPARWSADTMELYDKAIRLNPREAAYRAMQASYLERVADDPNSALPAVSALERSASLYEKAIRMQPRNEQYVLAAARVYGRLGQYLAISYFPSADRWLQRAESLDPLNPEIRESRASLLSKWGLAEPDKGRAGKLFQRAAAESEAAKSLRRGPTSPRQ